MYLFGSVKEDKCNGKFKGTKDEKKMRSLLSLFQKLSVRSISSTSSMSDKEKIIRMK
jgi:hypothetical protein